MSDEPATETSKQTVTFFLEKTSSFQVLYADGVIGSITPSGHAFLSFFLERAPIPKTVEQELNEDGTAGKIVNMTGKTGVLREIHTGITLTEQGLRELAKHVGKLLKNFES